MTIKEILQKSTKVLATKKIGSAAIDAELLLLHALNLSKNKPKTFRNDRTWIYAHNDEKLTKQQENLFFKLIGRRAKFEPVAYIVGKKEFYGLEFYVDKNILIPHPETEIIIEESLKDILAKTVINQKTIIADIGTGSGAIAITLAKILAEKNMINRYTIFATDISFSALKIARRNAKKHNCDKNITFRKGNLLKALPKNTKIDYLLANLPYGRKKYLREQIKNKTGLAIFFGTKYEPKISIFAADNGMKCFNKFFPNLPKYLADNAKIYLESDPIQIPKIAKLAIKYLPNREIKIFKDLRGFNRITKIKIL